MRKILLIFIIVIALVGCDKKSDSKPVVQNTTSNIKEVAPFDFRNTRWGMSKAEVKPSEPLKVVDEKDNALVYSTDIIGMPTYLIYFFVDDKLVRALYSLKVQHTNKNDYINDYNNLLEALNKKYPNPESISFWKNENSVYKDKESYYGMAISKGDLVMVSRWNTELTSLVLLLQGENFEVKLVVEYNSVKLKDLAAKNYERNAVKDL